MVNNRKAGAAVGAVAAFAAVATTALVGHSGAATSTSTAAPASIVNAGLPLGEHIVSVVPSALAGMAVRTCSHAPTPGLCWGGHVGSGTFTTSSAPGGGDVLLTIHLISAAQAMVAQQSLQAAASRLPTSTVVVKPDAVSQRLVNGKAAVLSEATGAATAVQMVWLLDSATGVAIDSLGVSRDTVLQLADGLH